MSRKEDNIVSVEVIQPRFEGDRDVIVVVKWSDNTKSLWFASKTPQYVKEIVHYCEWKGACKAREVLSLKTTY